MFLRQDTLKQRIIGQIYIKIVFLQIFFISFSTIPDECPTFFYLSEDSRALSLYRLPNR